MRHFVPVMLCLAFIGACGRSRPSPPSPPTLATTLNEVLNRLAGTGNICSARVVNLETGRELYAVRADQPLMPASSLKLLTSAAAIDRFGPDHTLKTYLAIDGNDLWIIGTGDPGTGDPRLASSLGQTPLTIFDDWADALHKRRITHLTGGLCYYDAALDTVRVHPTWNKAFLVDWYAAPVSGLNFNDNCIDITISPTTHGQPVHIQVMPPAANIHIVNQCLTADTHNPQITRDPDNNVFTISGTANKPARLESKPVTDPGAFFADAFRTHLASRGITIAGPTIRAASPLAGATPPPPANVIAVHHTPLAQAISRINKQSQNLFAEAVCKLLGQQFDADQGRSAPGSWESGGRAIHAFLRKHRVEDASVVIADGSGLSRANRVSARVLTDVLVAMEKHHARDSFRDSLSICGIDGSLAKRLTDLPGRVLGKTGFIGGVCSMAGYVQNSRGHWLCFAIIYNGNFGADEKPYQLLQDEACRILAQSDE